MEMEISFPGGKRVDAQYEGFTIQTDQSVKDGGDASAPEPFSLFLASMGTCAGIYVLSFCQQRKIPTDGIKLIQRMEDSADGKMVAKIIIEIILPSDFPSKYKKAVVSAAQLCAVKKHMENPPEFSIITSMTSE
ncbi:MAG: osmotically inducible protein C [Desulfobacteraceae bacterium]|nr:osmotically inducible protein C [Desulfobacteraceae bacterium]